MHHVLCAVCYILCNIGNVCMSFVLSTFWYVLYVMCCALCDMHCARCMYFICYKGISGKVLGSFIREWEHECEKVAIDS